MTTYKWTAVPPRLLHYRGLFKIYLVFAGICSVLITFFWSLRLSKSPWSTLYQDYPIELALSLSYFVFFGATYFYWLRPKLRRSVQVFSDHLVFNDGKKSKSVDFAEIESINMVYWSIFYIRLSSGDKHYFNSSLDRVDYVWEALRDARPDLHSEEVYETFRLKLVQFDHHQKRKEWFFRHKLADVINWGVLPLLFISAAYWVQAQDISIYQPGLYFFRLYMYSLLTLLMTTFFYSIILKKLVFDRKVLRQMEVAPQDKARDLEFEGVILQRSKLYQMITAIFVFAIVIKFDVNLYSLTKVKDEVASYNLMKGKSLIVDNRYNCLNCRYKIKEGDVVVFGRGFVGQMMAQEGDLVGEALGERNGRSIASSNVQEVPPGHIAVKMSNNEIIFAKLEDLIGKVQK